MGPVNQNDRAGRPGWLAALGRRLLPPRCLLCGERGLAALDLCRGCRDELPWNRPACARCALPLETTGESCGRCQRAPPPFDAAMAPLRYAAPADRLLQRLKFHGDLAAGRVLATLMGDAIGAPGDLTIVPVPLHRGRLGSRGYNQALELARPLAGRFGLALSPRLLQRARATAAQTELDAAARRRNVAGAFALRPGARVPERIALVDDTLTTGATVAECARMLRAGGASHVEVWVAARAP